MNFSALFTLCVLSNAAVDAFSINNAPASASSPTTTTLRATTNDNDDTTHFSDTKVTGRRNALQSIALATGSGILVNAFASPQQASAKVEGYAPPSKSLPEEYRQGTLTLADMDSNAPIPQEAYKKLPSGVIYADLREAGGPGDPIVTEGSRVNLQWVLRKSNGYFVDSSQVQDSVPFIFTVGSGGAIAGVDEGIRGMKVGGTRRLLIPPSLAYVDGLDDGKPGPMPAGFGPRQQMRRVQNVRKDVPGEYVFLEVQLTRIR